MALSYKRGGFVNVFMQGMLILFVLVFILCFVWIFVTGSPHLYGTLSIYGLLGAIGITLVIRYQRVGFLLLIGVNVWVAYLPVIPVWFAIFICFSMAFVLFACREKTTGKLIWSCMGNGLDYSHFRHIYQLGAILLCVVVSLMLFYSPVQTPAAVRKCDDNVTGREIGFHLLDSANVTLDELIAIEEFADSLPQETQLLYNRRIFALKHVLLSSLMSSTRSTRTLINICKVHNGDFSVEQQRVLDWYMGLSPEDQSLWVDCPPTDNLKSFEFELKQRITQ
ncbi:MAG: hypothetical protein K2L84_00210 [Muribaculaceae bacterium]|nr:hypothetical protein [Muribaculaceae bacterium]